MPVFDASAIKEKMVSHSLPQYTELRGGGVCRKEIEVLLVFVFLIVFSVRALASRSKVDNVELLYKEKIYLSKST